MDHDSTGKATPSTDSTYEVFVDDNYHYMDETERYSAGMFQTYGEALGRAKRIVDRSLLDLLEPGKSVGDLIASYVMFGEDPWIRPTPEGTERFSARDYARQRAREIVSGREDRFDGDEDPEGARTANWIARMLRRLFG